MTDSPGDGRTSKRAQAGFFSSAKSFFLPTGQQFEPGTVRGYYIDLRVKAPRPDGPRDLAFLHVASIQAGLGCYERYIAGEGEAWLDAAREYAEAVTAHQQLDGRQAGGFLHEQPLGHTFRLHPPWISAMAQGEAASLLVRVFLETGEERLRQSALLALKPLGIDIADGGVSATLDGGPFLQEYPTRPPSFVLNGGIFAIWGLYDVGVGLDHPPARANFERALDTLVASLERWDLGYWSRYDLFPHPVTNVASSFYHDLHINQLRAMHRLVPRPELSETAQRWAEYAASPACRRRATAHKALFRLLVPRNRLLAHRFHGRRVESRWQARQAS
jgi:heparosan-N-sulfate-glucuronate 5-epimerase